MAFDGGTPTLLDGYGGYGISMAPQYDPILGAAWLERGGVYALANIRGGGEFGPSWHRAAQRENRQRAFDDFIAVAEDLIATGITSPEHLGIRGHSNGGLLVGAVLTQRPELFNAAVALNPVLDLSQALDPDELGDAEDPRDWAYMREFSPYHNLSPEETYPKTLFMTATTDDRAPPGDARKMAARMEEMGHLVYFYEAREGTHGGGVTLHQQATREALIFTYLLDQLGRTP
jgi:prolyl oligopeptidase